jgi:hypothetical protein
MKDGEAYTSLASSRYREVSPVTEGEQLRDVPALENREIRYPVRAKQTANIVRVYFPIRVN